MPGLQGKETFLPRDVSVRDVSDKTGQGEQSEDFVKMSTWSSQWNTEYRNKSMDSWLYRRRFLKKKVGIHKQNKQKENKSEKNQSEH